MLGKFCNKKIVHDLRQQIQADFLPYTSTPVLERDMLHLACSVWAQAESHLL